MSSSDDRNNGGAKFWLPVVAGVALIAGIVALFIKLNNSQPKVEQKDSKKKKCPTILATRRRWPLEEKKKTEEDKKEEQDEPKEQDVDQECA